LTEIFAYVECDVICPCWLSLFIHVDGLLFLGRVKRKNARKAAGGGGDDDED